MCTTKHKKSKMLFLLFLAFAMGATDVFFRRRRSYQGSSSVMSRCMYLWQSDETANADNLPALIDQLDSQYPADRWAAAATLSRSGRQQAVPFLIRAMADERGTVRTCVMAQSLGILSDTRAVPALVKALDHPSNEDLRFCASQALGRIGDTEAIEPLIEAFRDDRVSFSALKALGQIGTPRAETFLESIVQNSPGSSDVAIARDALKDIGIGKKRNDSSSLQVLLSTAQGQRRRWIVELLARNSQIEAIEILANLLADDNESAEIRGIAAAGLVLRGHDSFAALHKLTESQSSKTRDLARSAILWIETNTGVSAPELEISEWLRGQATSLQKLRGKVVLLDFFQIICPGCHRVHPHILQMQEKYGKDGLQVIGIAVAFELQYIQKRQDIRDYVERTEFNYPVGIDKDFTKTFRAYKARGTPYAAIIDQAGNLKYLDFYNPVKVENIIQNLLFKDD